MSKYHSPIMRILSIITLVAFLPSQAALGSDYLRIQQANGNGIAEEISDKFDCTFADLEAEGYEIKEDLKDFGYRQELRVHIFKDGQEIERTYLTFYIYPQFKTIEVKDFYPRFPKPQTETEKIGRGRALLRHLFQADLYGGYDIISMAVPSFAKSFIKIAEWNPVSLDANHDDFLTISRQKQRTIPSKLPLYEAWCNATVYGVIQATSADAKGAEQPAVMANAAAMPPAVARADGVNLADIEKSVLRELRKIRRNPMPFLKKRDEPKIFDRRHRLHRLSDGAIAGLTADRVAIEAIMKHTRGLEIWGFRLALKGARETSDLFYLVKYETADGFIGCIYKGQLLDKEDVKRAYETLVSEHVKLDRAFYKDARFPRLSDSEIEFLDEVRHQVHLEAVGMGELCVKSGAEVQYDIWLGFNNLDGYGLPKIAVMPKDEDTVTLALPAYDTVYDEMFLGSKHQGREKEEAYKGLMKRIKRVFKDRVKIKDNVWREGVHNEWEVRVHLMEVEVPKSLLPEVAAILKSSPVTADAKGAEQPPAVANAAATPPAVARAQGEVKFIGKVVVIIDSDRINAEITKGNLISRGFDGKNVHIVVVDGIDVNAIEYGALGVTQELINKISAEIENLKIGADIDLIICNITSAEVFLLNLRRLSGINVTFVSGRDWEKNFQAIANSIGAAETSL